MTWTTISNATLAVDKYLTSPILIALRDNPGAIAAGDAGAPKNMLASLNIVFNSLSGSVAPAATTTITLSPVSFFPSIDTSQNMAPILSALASGTANVNTPKISFTNVAGSSATYSVQWYSIA